MPSGRAQIRRPSELDQALADAAKYLAMATEKAGTNMDHEDALKLAQVHALLAIAQSIKSAGMMRAHGG